MARRTSDGKPPLQARAEIRDEEWMVKAAKHPLPGGRAIPVTCTSESDPAGPPIFFLDLDNIRVCFCDSMTIFTIGATCRRNQSLKRYARRR